MANFNIIKSHESKYFTMLEIVEYTLNSSTDKQYYDRDNQKAASASSKASIIDSITLPLPDQLSEHLYGQWEDRDMIKLGAAIAGVEAASERQIADSAKAVMGGIAKLVSETASLWQGEDTKEMASVVSKTVFNPRKQMLYKGTRNREFTLNWTLSPRSLDEAEQIKMVIQHIRRATAPRLSTVAGSGFLVYPREFKISFRPASATLPVFQSCLCRNFTVDYGDNSNGGAISFFRDGTPTKIVLGMEMVEKDVPIVNSDYDEAKKANLVGTEYFGDEENMAYQNSMFGDE